MMEQGIGFLVLMRGIFGSKNEDRVHVCAASVGGARVLATREQETHKAPLLPCSCGHHRRLRGQHTLALLTSEIKGERIINDCHKESCLAGKSGFGPRVTGD